MVPVRQPLEEVGKFYVGDSYIVLNSKDGGERMEKEVYFWVGAESTRDEYTTACFQAASLGKLVGSSSQREDQDDESNEFKKVFWFGMTLLEGGVEGGLKHVSAGVQPMLYQIKGVRDIRIYRVEPSYTSLHHGEVFILDMSDVIYQWNGSESSMKEKAKALDFTTKVKQERGRLEIRVADERSDGEEDFASFWRLLGWEDEGTPPSVPRGEDGNTPEDDEAYEAALHENIALYEVSDAAGTLQVLQLTERPLSKSMLVTDDVYILDSVNDVFVWIGKGANEVEKDAGLKVGEHFFEVGTRSSWASITRVVEGAETYLFKEYFDDWHTPMLSRGGDADGPISYNAPASRVAKVEAIPVDVEALHAHDPPPSVDLRDAGGSMKIMVFESPSMIYTLPRHFHGHFFTADALVIIYTYQTLATPESPSATRFRIYFWAGRDADSRIFLQYELSLGRELKGKFSAHGMDVTIVQQTMYKESEHFHTLFPSGFIVHSGHGSDMLPIDVDMVFNFDNAHPELESMVPDDVFNAAQLEAQRDSVSTRLYHVRSEAGSSSGDVQMVAYEVEATASALNSGDAFVCYDIRAGVVYIWLGAGVNRVEVDLANKVGVRLRRLTTGSLYYTSNSSYSADGGDDDAEDSIITLPEAYETEAFWEALGGKKEYATSQLLRDADLEVYLYKASFASGFLTVSEVHSFCQYDLSDDAFFILDAQYEVYLRVPVDAEPTKTTRVETVLAQYIGATPPSARPKGITPSSLPVHTVVAGREPPAFTCHFQGWRNLAAATFVDPRAELLKAHKAETRSLGRRLRDAFKAKECSYSVTGDEAVEQGVFHCLTCKFVAPLAVCAACAMSCHAGHDLSTRVAGFTICSCGSSGECGSMPQ